MIINITVYILLVLCNIFCVFNKYVVKFKASLVAAILLLQRVYGHKLFHLFPFYALYILLLTDYAGIIDTSLVSTENSHELVGNHGNKAQIFMTHVIRGSCSYTVSVDETSRCS